jgi:L,D-peptidoglycan transpeptidase YkuD (ErfK/YbiS/YcfS/YnhG family)
VPWRRYFEKGRSLLDFDENPSVERLNIFRKFIIAVVVVSSLGTFGGVISSTAVALAPGQVITVEATASRSEVAVVRAWELGSDGAYHVVFGPVVAFVGVHGVGPTREGLGRTPDGAFSLTQAFGNEPNNGTRLPYFRAGPDDWWDENPASKEYNRHVRSPVSPGGNSENLYYSGGAYAHAVVINYNTDPVVKGAGSGFFLHVSMGVPTEGCVAVPAKDLNWLMRWLNPAKHPEISIGVGAKALAALGSTN